MNHVVINHSFTWTLSRQIKQEVICLTFLDSLVVASHYGQIDKEKGIELKLQWQGEDVRSSTCVKSNTFIKSFTLKYFHEIIAVFKV